MPTFDIETEKITAFDTGDTYIFKTYFEENQLFKQLETYYNKDKYRFEMPNKDLGEVRKIFDKYYYELSVIANPEDYSVVVSKETDSRDILRNSVMKKDRGQHETLIIEYELSKEKPIEQGAVGLEKIGVNRRN